MSGFARMVVAVLVIGSALYFYDQATKSARNRQGAIRAVEATKGPAHTGSFGTRPKDLNVRQRQ